MANRRMISKSISVSKKLAQVSPFAALLFTWTIPHCDDGGNAPGDPFTLKGLVVPVRPETVSEVERAVKELIDIGLFVCYESEKEPFIHIHNWEKHQTLRKDRASWLYPGYPDDNRGATDGQPNDNQRGAKVREGKVSKGKIREENTIKYLEKVPEKDINQWIERFVVTKKEILSISEDLKLYCERKGKKYSNYRSFLLNAIKREYKERDGKDGKYSKI